MFIIWLLVLYNFITINGNEVLNLGYLHTGVVDSFYEEMFKKLVSIKGNKLTLTYKDYIINSDLSNLEDVVNQIKNDNVYHVFTNEVLFSVADQFNNQSFYVWMSYPFALQKCTKNVIYYSSLVPELLTCILIHIIFVFLHSKSSYYCR